MGRGFDLDEDFQTRLDESGVGLGESQVIKHNLTLFEYAFVIYLLHRFLNENSLDIRLKKD